MTEQDVRQWLDEYGRAWVEGDPEQAAALFTGTAVYRVTPFANPMKGRPAIRKYWQEGAADAQENVAFSAQVWAVVDQTAIAGWQASFTRKGSGTRVELDGTFRLTFAAERGALRCARLEEWWHHKES